MEPNEPDRPTESDKPTELAPKVRRPSQKLGKVPSELIEAFIYDLLTIPKDRFTAYQKGWEGQLGMALIDAVYSQQTQYTTERGKGLLPRLLAFKDKHPGAGKDLLELTALPEEELRLILGNGVTNGRSKASAALEAAGNLVALNVFTTEQYDHRWGEHRRAYLTVHGLGPITHNYLGMLLGYPDTKPDVWIIRAVQRVANEANIDLVVNAKIARYVLTETHERTGWGETVTHLDHAVWLTERERHTPAD